MFRSSLSRIRDLTHAFRTVRSVVTTSESSKNRPHIPVMVAEVVKGLNPYSGQVFLDMTFGAGGHTSALLEVCPDLTILALDRDPLAIEAAQELAQKYTECRIVPLHGRFSDLPTLLAPLGWGPESVDLVLLDLGASSMQMDSGERGFALTRDAPLDMRMDSSDQSGVTAADVVNGLDSYDLAQIFQKYGEERAARKVAYAIADYRATVGRIDTSGQLAEVVEKAVGM